MIGVVAGQIVTPSGCGITLTNTGLGPFGLADMMVVGQTASATGDGTTNFGVSSGLAGAPITGSGIKIFEVEMLDVPSSPAIPLIQLARASDFINVTVRWDTGSNEWIVFSSDGSGALIGYKNVAGASTDTFAIGVDAANGDVSVYQNGSPVVDKTTTPDFGTLAAFGGMFSGANAVIVVQARSMALGDITKWDIRTNGTAYTQTYPVGVKDWCGNAI